MAQLRNDNVNGAGEQEQLALTTSKGRFSLLAIIIVIVVSGATFGFASRLDPEPYHDGAQVGPAVAISSGMVIHRDVFDAYGPITAWLQGTAMVLFGPTVLTARLLSAALLVLVAVLLYFVLRVSGRGIWIAMFGSILWVVSWPGGAVSWGTPLLPWPSITFLVLQLGTVVILLRRTRSTEESAGLMALAGVLVSLGVLTRPNYGVPLALAALFAMVILSKSLKMTKREWIAVAFGGIVGIAIPLAVLFATGALPAFIDQAVIGPLAGESDATSNGTAWFYIENAYLWGSLPLIAGLVILVVIGRWKSRPRWLLPTVGAVGSALLVVWASAALVNGPVRSAILSRLTWSPALDGQIIQPLFLSAILTLLVGAVGIGAVVVMIVRRRLSVPPANSRGALLLVLTLTSLASLAQLFPIADPNHLWWAAPLPLALLFFMLGQVASRQARVWTAVVVIAPTLLLVSFSMYQYFTIPRIEIGEGVMKGMLIDESRYPDYQAVDSWLRDIDPASVEFSCEQGLFAVWNGKYLADSPSFVNWAHRMESASAGSPTGRVIRCTYPYDEVTAEEFAASRGLRIVRTLPSVSLSYFTTIRLDEMVPSAGRVNSG